MSSPAERSGGLALWIIGPLVGLFLVLLATSGLPSPNCGGSEDTGYAQDKVVLIAVTAAMSALTVLAAARRLRGLALAGRPAWGSKELTTAAGIWLLLAALLIFSHQARITVLVLLLLGVVLTIFIGLALVVALVRGRSVDEVGLLVPGYLLGAGLLAYPGLTVTAFAFRGLAC